MPPAQQHEGERADDGKDWNRPGRDRDPPPNQDHQCGDHGEGVPEQPPPASAQPPTGPRCQDRRQGHVDLGHIQPHRGQPAGGAAEAAHSALTFAHTQDPPEDRP